MVNNNRWTHFLSSHNPCDVCSYFLQNTCDLLHVESQVLSFSKTTEHFLLWIVLLLFITAVILLFESLWFYINDAQLGSENCLPLDFQNVNKIKKETVPLYDNLRCVVVWENSIIVFCAVERCGAWFLCVLFWQRLDVVLQVAWELAPTQLRLITIKHNIKTGLQRSRCQIVSAA